MSFISKTSPLFIVFVTVFGLFMHEMHVDRATTNAVRRSAAIAVTSANTTEKDISMNYHTHVERASLGRTLPKMQPARDDGRRYIQNKKLFFSGGDNAIGIWPSV